MIAQAIGDKNENPAFGEMIIVSFKVT